MTVPNESDLHLTHPQPTESFNPAQALFVELDSERESFLDRAYDNAELTIPNLIRRNGDNSFTDPDSPWDSSGAYLVNNLTNKITLSLFPAGLPWIKLRPSRAVLASLSQLDPSEAGELSSEIHAALSVVEKEDFANAIAEDGDQATLTRSIKHLLVAGNYCLQVTQDGTLKGRNLKRFCTRRDGQGRVIEAAIVDPVTYASAADDIKAAVLDHELMNNPNPNGDLGFEALRKVSAQPVFIHTHIFLNAQEDRWEVRQYVHGNEIEGTFASFARDELPYMFPVYSINEGENFGRSYCEDYLADLEAVDGMSETVQTGTAIVARIIHLVRPGGVTSKKQLQEARNGDFITGDENDVSVLRSDKQADLQLALQINDRVLTRLGRAFLVNSTVQRNGERVTAEEIRFLAQELEDQLGGAYADLVVSLQTPYAKQKLFRLQVQGRVPNWPRDQVNLTIITGAAALTRQSKVSSVLRILSVAAQVVGPQALAQKLNVDTLMNILAEGEGVDLAGLVLTDEEVSARANEQATRDAAVRAAPEATRAVSEAVQAQQQQPAPPAAQ